MLSIAVCLSDPFNEFIFAEYTLHCS